MTSLRITPLPGHASTIGRVAAGHDAWLESPLAASPEMNAHRAWFHVAEDEPSHRGELRFAATEREELLRAYKTPSLRGVAERAPCMHAGQLSTLAEVVAHYDRAPAAPAGHSELRPFRLSASERRQIEAFLRTLSAPVSAPAAGPGGGEGDAAAVRLGASPRPLAPGDISPR